MVTVQRMLCAVADVMEAERDALCALDGEIGDADHGIAMAEGFRAVRTALEGFDGTPTEAFNTAAKAFLNAVGASSGPLYATAFIRAAKALKDKEALTDGDATDIVQAMAEGIAFRGKANPGDKTMLDAWEPAAKAAAGGSFAEILTRAAEAAEAGAEATAQMQAKLGRAARLGKRSIGHMDPGAVSAALMLRAMAGAV